MFGDYSENMEVVLLVPSTQKLLLGRRLSCWERAKKNMGVWYIIDQDKIKEDHCFLQAQLMPQQGTYMIFSCRY